MDAIARLADRPNSRLLTVIGLVLAIGGGLLPGCSEGRGRSDLILIAFAEDQRTDLHRDQVLDFEFTARVDPATIDLDTFQIYTGSAANPVPFMGLYEVDGNFVHFHPAVDESNQSRGQIPVNPYGFAGNTTYQVRIPGTNDTPAPLKVLETPRGRPLLWGFKGSFTTGSEFGPRPGEGAPTFAPFDAAVYRVPGSRHPGTVEPHDDVLSFSPVPNPSTPPVHPTTSRPDFRAGHPTHVRAQMTFTRVMDPRTIRSGDGGTVRLEFNLPGTQDWRFIPTTVSHTPNGRTFVLTAATPLAHASRFNRYRVVIDQSVTSLTSRPGRPLVMAVERWDHVRQRMLWVDVTEPHLTFWCGKFTGESGPLLTATFPLEEFARDAAESDADVAFGAGRLDAGGVWDRVSDDRTPCQLPGNACTMALREPLTQSTTSTKPNPNAKGPSKIQFLYNSPQHAANGPNPTYKLANAEALIGMEWGPRCTTVIKSAYPKLHIHVMWSDRNSSLAIPAGLASTTYNNNFDKNPPGFPVRDGKTPYEIEHSSASVTWYPWKFERPFLDYRTDKGLVFMAWTEEGGDVEQYPRWYSPNNAPNTRIFSGPSSNVNPAVGQAGQWCYYWARFRFKRIRSLAVSRFFRLTSSEHEKPAWHAAVVSPSAGQQPGGTATVVSFRGARFGTYSKQGGKYWRGEGRPISAGAWDTNVTRMNDYPAVAIRVEFIANPTSPNDLPYIDQVALTYRLR